MDRSTGADPHRPAKPTASGVSRRRLFAAVASLGSAGLAGCATDAVPILRQSDGPADADEAGTTDDGPAEHGATDDAEPLAPPPEDRRHDGDVVTFETGPRAVAMPRSRYYVGAGARVWAAFEAPATPDSPAVVRAAVRNDGDRAQALPLWTLPPFEDPSIATPGEPGSGATTGERDGAATTGHAPRSLYLIPTGDGPLADGEPSYERGPEGYWRLSEPPGDALPDTYGLQPDETAVGLFYLLGDAGSRGFPTGQYEFGAADASSGGDGDRDDGDDDRVDDLRVGSDRSLRLTVWNTETPGPSPDSRFEPGELPPLSVYGDAPEAIDVPSTVWYHEADASTPRYLRADTERAELPAGDGPSDPEPAELGFELVNNSTEPLTGGGGSFDLWKLAGGEWLPLRTRFRTSEAIGFPPGQRRSWTFEAYHGAVPEPDHDQPVPATRRGHLGGGTYAFRSTITLDSEETYAAAFELVGDPIAIEPRDDLDVDDRGDRVVVTDLRRRDEPAGRLVVERVDDADERVVPEQVMGRRDAAFRNALPFFEPGVDAVELRSDSVSPYQALDFGESTRRFTFRGDAFEARWIDSEAEQVAR